MKTATLASNRTAAGAERSLNEGLQIAFRFQKSYTMTRKGKRLIYSCPIQIVKVK